MVKSIALNSIIFSAFLSVLMLTAPFLASGQIQVHDSVNVETLVNDVLLGGDLTATNITYNGNPVEDAASNHYGTFEIINSAFPISEGAVLATNGIEHLLDIPISQTENFQGDPDLSAIAGGMNVNNCAIIEFDVVAPSDTFLIDYIFASEEYPFYTCSQFNDVFGLFVSGPGLEGPFLNDAVNIAVIPATDIPIGVNTVNSGSGSQGNNEPCLEVNPNFQEDSIYFMANSPPLNNSISTPGHTHMFTAFAPMVTGQTYHIKFAIANAIDNIFQSAVFMRKGSVSNTSGLNPLTVSLNPSNFDVVPEGILVAGTFNYFIPEPMELSPQGIYTYEAMVPSNMNITYKFYNGTGTPELVNDDCGISGALSSLSRYVIMPDSPLVLDTVCFGSCGAPCSILSTQEQERIHHLEIFPNPGTELVQIVLPENGNHSMEVSVLDLTGKIILQKSINSNPGGVPYQLDVAALQNGMYVVQITADRLIYASKLVKE
ncbi:MAG: choice-of-anchor L domain-containing protein [Cryomorphaceae bacterium]|nr:T9SS type A sorting domain-containing protein [Flavobacteriales bacterium]